MSQCRGLTRSGQRCRNNALPGKTYCGIKSHKANQTSADESVLFRVAKALLKFALLALGLAGGIIGVVSYCDYLQDKKVNATSGVLESSGNATDRLFAIGSTFFRIGSDNDVFLQEDGDPLISVHMVDGKLYVSAVIRNDTGEIVAELRRNEWHINKKNYFDRNYTDQALEVVDHSGRVVLQAVNFGYVIHFACVLYRKDGSPVSLVPLPSGGALMQFKSGVGGHAKILPIFEYPSERHLGACQGLESLEALISKAASSPDHRAYYLKGPLDVGGSQSRSKK